MKGIIPLRETKSKSESLIERFSIYNALAVFLFRISEFSLLVLKSVEYCCRLVCDVNCQVENRTTAS